MNIHKWWLALRSATREGVKKFEHFTAELSKSRNDLTRIVKNLHPNAGGMCIAPGKQATLALSPAHKNGELE